MLSDPNENSPANIDAAVAILSSPHPRDSGNPIKKRSASESGKQWYYPYQSESVCYVISLLMLKQFDSFGRGFSSGGKLSSVATLLADINRIWDASLKSKDLVVLETSSTYVQENGMNVGSFPTPHLL